MVERDHQHADIFRMLVRARGIELLQSRPKSLCFERSLVETRV
jgi:hypothetical protein